MEITLQATIFSFFGWNIYQLIKKYREKIRQNYIRNLIDQESDYLIMNVTPYKKVKVNEETQITVKPTYSKYVELGSNDAEFIQYKSRKTILDDVKLEKFQQQNYVDNTKQFDTITIPSRKDAKNNKNNKDFSFSSQNQEFQEVERFWKDSKIKIDDCLLLDSPKQINKKNSNKTSEKKKKNQFSSLKNHFDNQDPQQLFDNCKIQLSNTEQKKADLSCIGKKNILQISLLQQVLPTQQINEKQNQQQEQSQNIFEKFITKEKPKQVCQHQEYKQQSPLKQINQPQQNNVLSINPLIQINQNPQINNDVCQFMNNQLVNQQLQQTLEVKQQEPQTINLFQNLPSTNVTFSQINLNNQNQDCLNQNCSNDTKQSGIIQNNTSNFTFGNKSNIQQNSSTGLFGGLLGSLGNETNIIKDQFVNNQNTFEQTQSNLIQSQPKTGTSLFGNRQFPSQQIKEQSQQWQTGELFNFGSNNQTGSNQFSNLLKN